MTSIVKFGQCQPQYEGRTFILNGVVGSSLCVLGLFGNVMSVLVLTKRFLSRSPFRMMINALCLSDMGTLICSLYMFCIPIIVDYNFRYAADISQIVNQCIVFFYPAGNIFRAMSCWFITVISVYRYINTVNYTLYTRVARRDIIRSIIACIAIGSFLFNVTRWMELRIEKCHVLDPQNRTVELSEVRPTTLRNAFTYRLAYLSVACTVLIVLAPFAIICVINCYIGHRLVSVCRSKSLRESMQKHQYGQIFLTSLLMCVCLGFLVCNSLSAVVSITETVLIILYRGRAQEAFEHLPQYWKTLVDVSNFLVIVQCNFNFLMYLLFAGKFRKAVSFGFQTIFLPSSIMRSQRGSRTLEKNDIN